MGSLSGRSAVLNIFLFYFSLIHNIRNVAGSDLEIREATNLTAFDMPNYENLTRYSYLSAIAMDGYLYIDGGEISRTDIPQDDLYEPAKASYSLDLHADWERSEADFLPIVKDTNAPQLNRQRLFRAPDNKTFYSWGGEASINTSPKPVELWGFKVDQQSNGTGSWSVMKSAQSQDIASLTKTVSGSLAQSANTAWHFGGLSNDRTDPNQTGEIAPPGIIEFDLKTLAITNRSSEGFGDHGTLVGGGMDYVPFGPDGMVLIMGGYQTPKDKIEKQWMDFSTVTLWDPTSGKFHTQSTTGQRPPSLRDFCIMGIKGRFNTYEIFILGGVNKDGVTQNGGYSLSLPGFVFINIPDDAADPVWSARAAQTCVLVNPRQALTFGGVQLGEGEIEESRKTKDPRPYGMSFFNLSKLDWWYKYNVGERPYYTPGALQTWYADGGLDRVAWSSDDLRNIFTNVTLADENGAPPGHDLPAGEQMDDNPNDEEQLGSATSEKKETPIGAVAGGVVGGLAIVGLLGLLSFYLVRRRKQRRARTVKPTALQYFPDISQPMSAHYVPSKGWGTETYAPSPPMVPNLPVDSNGRPISEAQASVSSGASLETNKNINSYYYHHHKSHPGNTSVNRQELPGSIPEYEPTIRSPISPSMITPDTPIIPKLG